MAEIVLEGVTKVYPDGTQAVSALDLTIADGQLTVLVGPSGCGKSTVLLMVAGLEEVSEGTIRIGDDIVNDVVPRDRDIAMVFQNYALYPHMSVYKNMAFGLRMRKVAPREIERRVREAAGVLGLTDDLLAKKPKQLSGGQRQRVAMGRAIVRDPQAFLMDEPLSNLDAKLRVEMRAEIARLQRELGVTTIYVTHDQTEAMMLGHQLVLLNEGHLQQVGPPQTVYDEPANVFVAGFIGSPAMNLIEANVAVDGGEGPALVFGGQRLLVPEDVAARAGLRAFAGRTVTVGIRPEHTEDASLVTRPSPWPTISATVSLREAMGPETYLHVTIGRVGCVARVSPQSRAREGEVVRLAVDVSALHFFDPAGGVSIRSIPEPAPPRAETRVP